MRPAIASLTKRIGDDRAAVRRESAAQLGVDPNRPLVLVTGGSLGAQSLNRAIASSAADLLAHAQIIHLTGRGKISEVRELVTASAGADVLTGIGPESAGQGDYHTAEYLERIDLAFACADLVICRAGAGSVSELAATGPAGITCRCHRQRRAAFHAEPVVNAGGGLLVADKDLTPQWCMSMCPICSPITNDLPNSAARHGNTASETLPKSWPGTFCN